jgi:hypothetical protein
MHDVIMMMRMMIHLVDTWMDVHYSHLASRNQSETSHVLYISHLLFVHSITLLLHIHAEEEALLRIKFWEGSYHAGFGSIFPTEDICALIPDVEADVAILEEPEHLNWFRVPATPQQLAAADNVDSQKTKEKVDDKKEGSGDKIEGEEISDKSSHSTGSNNAESNNILGWAHKVSHECALFGSVRFRFALPIHLSPAS